MKQYSNHEFGHLQILVNSKSENKFEMTDFQIAVIYKGNLLTTTYARALFFGRKEATEYIKEHKKDILYQISDIDDQVMT